MTETVAEILHAHRSGSRSPAETVARTYERIRAHGDPALFISLRDEKAAIAEAEALQASGSKDRPLFGVPVAIKDNIDAEGFSTTAACPAFAYKPQRDATAVARLRAAGAIVIGKTNLDQFATGLVGVRSPYGVPRNAINPELVPGGSSSGSAAAVGGRSRAACARHRYGGLRPRARGLNNIVGLKPSLGLISTAGVVPACRSLDCVSVFALTTDDAWAALAVMAGPDAADPYSRSRPLKPAGAFAKGTRVGVPIAGQRVFFGDSASAAAFDRAIARAAALGLDIVEVDIEPFYETARLLYEGPWVAERYIVLKSLLASSPESIHPVTREIIVQGARPSAVDTFAAFYKLEELRRVRDVTFRSIDALLLPTAPTAYTVKQVLADPIQLNSRLGTYTNFVNLLDLCGLAVPASMRDDGIPFGVTLLAPGGHDGLAGLDRTRLSRRHRPADGRAEAAAAAARDHCRPCRAAGEIAIAVVGAHLSGMPLNGELKALGGRLLEETATAPDYRLYALTAANPPKPGLLRVAQGQGSAIALEIWALTAEGFGRFVAGIPSPMSIGTLRLADGRSVKGFLVEADAVAGAPDISGYGGWRNYLAKAKAAAG